MHILFVCTGNICRSPTAERLANAYAAELGLESLEAASAGTRAVVNRPMHDSAAAVLAGLGGDPSQFGARQLTKSIVARADLIVTMTRDQRDSVLDLAPVKLRRTFTLVETAFLVTSAGAQSVEQLAELRANYGVSEFRDIQDPIGQSRSVFDSVGLEIARLVRPLIEFVTKL